MTSWDDEAEERQRQARERAGLSPEDQLYGPKKRTASGTYSLQHNRRTGRKLQFNTHIRPKLRHIIEFAMRRDKVPSVVVFFELMLDAYLQVYGPLKDGDIPSDQEIVDLFLKEQEDRDGQ